MSGLGPIEALGDAAINDVRPPVLRYHAQHELVREFLAGANAMLELAGQLGLIDPEEDGEIRRSFAREHPELHQWLEAEDRRDVVTRDGNVRGLNTRSMLALRRGGVPLSTWTIVDRTGQALYERVLTRRLIRNGLSSAGTDVLRITGAGSCASSLR